MLVTSEPGNGHTPNIDNFGFQEGRALLK
uniref:Uncharacterized protein n=1 Tax=Anguilla anguilla TaxID=7936 RepID=A0A0E9TVJ0_ANGAN